MKKRRGEIGGKPVQQARASYSGDYHKSSRIQVKREKNSSFILHTSYLK